VSRVDLDHLRVLSTDPGAEVRDNFVDEGSDQPHKHQESCHCERVFQSHPGARATGQVQCHRPSGENDRKEEGNTMPPGQASEAGGSRGRLFVHSPRHTAAGSTSLINRGVLPSRQRVLQSKERLGIRPGQVNALVRLTLRPHEHTLTDEQANQI